MPRNGPARDYYYEDDTYIYERDRDRDCGRDRYANGSRQDGSIFKEERVEIDTDERDDIEFYRRGRRFSGGSRGGPALQEIERVRVRDRERERDRSAPDFMRESFAPRKEAGQLVLSRDRDRDREREREWDETDVSMAVAEPGRGRERGERREVDLERDHRQDIYVQTGESRGRRLPRREVESEEIIIKERDERERRRRPSPVDREIDREEIVVQERDFVERRRRRPPVRRDVERDEVVVKKRDRSLPVRRRSYEEAEEVIVRRDRRDARPRRRSSLEGEREEVTFRFEEVDNGPRRRYEIGRDDVHYASRSRRRPSSSRRRSQDEEIIIQTSERDRGSRKANVERDEEITIRERERDRGGRRGDVQAEEEEIIIRHGERERGHRRAADADRIEEDIMIRMRERDDRQRKKESDVEQEEIIIRQSERDRKRREKRREEDEEIIIRHREERSPSPGPAPLREPPVIRAPPIHQEVITHHRHIDHGFEPARAPSPETKTPRSSFEELEFRHRETRGRSSHEEDIVIERRGKHESPSPVRRPSTKRYEQSKNEEVVISRSRPLSVDREREIVIRERERRNTLDSRDELDIREEADFYERRSAERASIGEAYHGMTKDWTIVDVPPGTKRVTMEGVGGASEEISWQRYNGVRRSRFLPNGEASSSSSDEESSLANTINSSGVIGRRYHGVKDKRDRLWTEITKDLVLKEALDRAGYEYEETEYFYYVFSYLRYDDISALVDMSDEIRRARRERIHEIHRERLSLPPPPVKTPAPAQQPWKRVEYTEEVVNDEGRRPSRRW